MSSIKINAPVRLSEGKVENFPDFVNLIFEYLVFFKWIYFKNRPRANLLLIRSVLLTSTFFSIYFLTYGDFTLVLEGIEIDPFLAFGGSTVFGFWHMTNGFYKKTDSASTLYYKVLESLADKNIYKSELLGCELAVRLITLDLWSHRLYREFFAETLEKALSSDHSMSGSKGEELILRINNGRIHSKEARMILQNYRKSLMKQSSEIKAA